MLRHLDTGRPVELLDMLFSETRAAEGRPWVMLNMVESIDGATAVEGGASALNDSDDRALFLALRSVADIVLNGAGTVRAENLGPIRMSEEMARYREEAGMGPEPRMVILTRSLDLDPGHRVFADPTRRPRILTGVDADPGRASALEEVADVTRLERLDGDAILGAVGEASVVLCEGGPTINSQLIAAGVVDEVNLTVSPVLALGGSKRVASGPPLEPLTRMRLDRKLIGDESVFLRFVRTRPGP